MDIYMILISRTQFGVSVYGQAAKYGNMHMRVVKYALLLYFGVAVVTIAGVFLFQAAIGIGTSDTATPALLRSACDLELVVHGAVQCSLTDVRKLCLISAASAGANLKLLFE